jgi:hypothetical protein
MNIFRKEKKYFQKDFCGYILWLSYYCLMNKNRVQKSHGSVPFSALI